MSNLQNKILTYSQKTAIFIGCISSSLLIINTKIIPIIIFIPLFSLILHTLIKFNMPNDENYKFETGLNKKQYLVGAFFAFLFILFISLGYNFILSFIGLFSISIILMFFMKSKSQGNENINTPKERFKRKFKYFGNIFGLFNAVIGNGIIVATGALKGINNILSAMKINAQLDTDLSNLSTVSTILIVILFLAGVSVSANLTRFSIAKVFESIGSKIWQIKDHLKNNNFKSIFNRNSSEGYRICLRHLLFGIMILGAVFSVIYVGVINGLGSTLEHSAILQPYKLPIMIIVATLTFVASSCLLGYNSWKTNQSDKKHSTQILSAVIVSFVYGVSAINPNDSTENIIMRSIGGLFTMIIWYMIFANFSYKKISTPSNELNSKNVTTEPQPGGSSSTPTMSPSL